MAQAIQDGFDVFLQDGGKSVGAVRAVHANALVIYIENAGDFEVPLSAIQDVHSEKVMLDFGKLDEKLKEAVRKAHSAEDPRIP